MSDVAYIVNPMSAADIEIDSCRFLNKYQRNVLYGLSPLNAEILLDNIFEDKGYSLEITENCQFYNGMLGATNIETKTIQIRESDFNTCDTNGFARMNIAHEVAHPRLHSEFFEQNSCKLFRMQGNRIPAFVSSEWQASVWGSCCLMPFPAIAKFINECEAHSFSEKQIVESISNYFIVSKIAAQVRYLTINKYIAKGNYKEIVNRLEKMS